MPETTRCSCGREVVFVPGIWVCQCGREWAPPPPPDREAKLHVFFADLQQRIDKKHELRERG